MRATRTPGWSVLAYLVLGACGSTAPAEPAPPVTASATMPEASAMLPAALPCLPLVSGCGCSYACGHAIHANEDGSYDVTWWGQDSRSDRATLGQLCLPDGRCREAFQDGTGCGGECIPTDAHFACHLDAAGSCVP